MSRDSFAHVEDVRYLSLDQVIELANRTVDTVEKARSQYSGSDFASRQDQLRTLLKRGGVDYKSIKALLSEKLSSLN